MTKTEKYNFKVSAACDEKPANSDFEEITEKILVDLFEREILTLKNLNKPTYSMIELGSNQCYYSLLFRHILKTTSNTILNIMVEPRIEHLEKGKREFKLNNCNGIFYNNSIGEDMLTINGFIETNTPQITLNQILIDNNLSDIDVLHCDIDGMEEKLIEQNSDFFIKGKSKYIFLCTHVLGNGHVLHNKCKSFFNTYCDNVYDLIFEEQRPIITTDMLLVYKTKSNINYE